MEEMWKDCYGWESFYEVSNLGNIRSKKRPVPTQFGITTRGGVSIKKIVAKNGYECVNLTGGGKRRQELVHRLVLLSFIGEPEKGHQTCHNDGVRHNNKLQNLRWDSAVGRERAMVLCAAADYPACCLAGRGAGWTGCWPSRATPISGQACAAAADGLSSAI